MILSFLRGAWPPPERRLPAPPPEAKEPDIPLCFVERGALSLAAPIGLDLWEKVAERLRENGLMERWSQEFILLVLADLTRCLAKLGQQGQKQYARVSAEVNFRLELTFSGGLAKPTISCTWLPAVPSVEPNS